MHIVEHLAKLKSFTTRKPVDYPGLGSIYPSKGCAIKLWRETDKNELLLRGILHCQVGQNRGAALVHLRQAEAAIDQLILMAQGDLYLRDLSTGHYCLHGTLKPSVEHSNLTFIPDERMRLLPIFQATHPQYDGNISVRLGTSSGLKTAQEMSEGSVAISYMGRKIDTVPINSKKVLSFLGADYAEPEEFVVDTLAYLRKSAIKKEDTNMVAVPKLTVYNALPVFRGIYFLYEAYCRLHGKDITIPFPEKVTTDMWNDYVPQTVGTEAVDLPTFEIKVEAVDVF